MFQSDDFLKQNRHLLLVYTCQPWSCPSSIFLLYGFSKHDISRWVMNCSIYFFILYHQKNLNMEWNGSWLSLVHRCFVLISKWSLLHMRQFFTGLIPKAFRFSSFTLLNRSNSFYIFFETKSNSWCKLWTRWVRGHCYWRNETFWYISRYNSCYPK